METARLFAVFAAIFLVGPSFGQVTLSGISYTEDFDDLLSGLPTGWSVHTGSTDSTLGASGNFTSATTTWASTSSLTDFRNVSSNTVAFGAATGTQASNPDRALGWRPLAAGTNARTGSLMLTLANTTGFTDFSLSAKVFTGNDGFNGSQSYLLEYRVGNSGAFTSIGTYTTPITGATGFNAQTLIASSITLSALSNQSSPIYLRLRGTTTTGTSLDTIALDNFTLNYTAVPEPSTYAAIIGAVALVGAAVHRRRQRGKAATV